MCSRHVFGAAAALAVVFVCVYALAQGQPQPPQPQPQPQQKNPGRTVLKNYYMEGEEELKSFTYKEQPPFKIYKPNDKWHFVDVSKFSGAQIQAIKDPQQRQKVEGFFKLCKCMMYNADIDAEARVVVGLGYGKKTLDQLMQEMETSLKQGYSDYKRISCKGKKKGSAAGACLIFEGTPKDQKKDRCLWYMFLKGDAFYQLRIHAVQETFDDNKKDFDALFKKWKI